jgi:heme exporter protein B
MFQEVKILVKKEILSEIRNRTVLSSIVLYSLVVVFVVFQMFKTISDPIVWNALLWVIVLFTSINSVTKSFISESSPLQFYMYQLASPGAIILSKIIYNLIFVLFINTLTFIIYGVFLGFAPINKVDFPLYMTLFFLGASGFAITFTTISAIASRTNNNFGLMAVMSLPIILPFIYQLVEVSAFIMDGKSWDEAWRFILVIFSLNLATVILSYLLFPYLWRD